MASTSTVFTGSPISGMPSVFCIFSAVCWKRRLRHRRLDHVAHLQEEGLVVGLQRVVLEDRDLVGGRVAQCGPTCVLRSARSAAIRPLRQTSRYTSGCTDSVPWPTSELLITTPACTMSPGCDLDRARAA